MWPPLKATTFALAAQAIELPAGHDVDGHARLAGTCLASGRLVEDGQQGEALFVTRAVQPGRG